MMIHSGDVGLIVDVQNGFIVINAIMPVKLLLLEIGIMLAIVLWRMRRREPCSKYLNAEAK